MLTPSARSLPLDGTACRVSRRFSIDMSSLQSEVGSSLNLKGKADPLSIGNHSVPGIQPTRSFTYML